jgi:hypothetical protein
MEVGCIRSGNPIPRRTVSDVQNLLVPRVWVGMAYVTSGKAANRGKNGSEWEIHPPGAERRRLVLFPAWAGMAIIRVMSTAA